MNRSPDSELEPVAIEQAEPLPPLHRAYVWAVLGGLAVTVALMVALFVSVKAGWRRDYANRFIVTPLVWVLPAMALIGFAGPFVTGQKRWLLLALAAMVAAALTFAAVMARSTWGV